MQQHTLGTGELHIGASRWSLESVSLAVRPGVRRVLVELTAATTKAHGSRGERGVSFWGEHAASLSGPSALGELAGVEIELREIEGGDGFFVAESQEGESLDGGLNADGGQALRIESINDAQAVVSMASSFSFELYEKRESRRVEVRLRCRAAVVWEDE